MSKVYKSSLSERGQASIPSAIRSQAKLTPGTVLNWEFINDREIRVFIEKKTKPVGALKMLGFARQYSPEETRSTDDILNELREGDNE